MCKNIIFLQVPPWNSLWTRQNHFSLLFAENNYQILYVEANRSFFKNFSIKNYFKGVRINKVSANINVLSIPFLLPGSKYFDLIANINAKIQTHYILNWLKKNDWSNYNCWCRVPISYFTVKKLNPKKIYYDVTDDYKLYERNFFSKKQVVRREYMLSSISDRIFITNKILSGNNAFKPEKISFIPNGFKKSFFNKNYIDKVKNINTLIRKLKKPVIAYIGLISYWMDFELLEKMDKEFPENLVFIGPINKNIKHKLKNLNNIKFLGKIEQVNLKNYLKEIDILIIPQVKSELRKKSNPLKFWEYLATGKPIVTIPFPVIKNFKNLVYISDTNNIFIENIHKAINNLGKDKKVNERILLSEKYTWKNIFYSQLLTIIENK